MIKIQNTIGRNIEAICDYHFTSLKPVILQRLGQVKLRKRQQEFIKNNLEEIIKAKPDDLLSINRAYVKFCGAKGYGSITNVKYNLNRVFDYQNFSFKWTPGYNAYELTKRLGFNTCPYCNRGFIYTVEGSKEKIVRPDIDHFHAKNEYPLLGLSFYNLIPSCLVCNRTLKGKRKVQSCLNPYEDGFGNALIFNYFIKDVGSGKGFNNNYTIFFKENELTKRKVIRCNQNVDLFRLKEIYEQSHGNEIAEIIKKHEISSGKYLQMVSNMFPKLGTVEELYNIAFNNYYLEEDFDKRPLSKLTKDIFDQLKFFVLDSSLIKC
jgi:hypothetical protein